MILDLDKRAITYLPGVGPKKAEILQKEAHIVSYEDLLHYFPYKYVDRSRFYRVDEVTSDMPYIQLKGRITHYEQLGEGKAKRLVGKFTDGSGVIDLVWFKGIHYVRASSSLPLLSRTVWIRKQPYLDGGIGDSIPVKKSQELGNEKTVVVLTRDRSYRKGPNKVMPLIRLRYQKEFPRLVERMKDRHIRYNETLDYLIREEKAGRVFVICPEKPVEIGRIEKDREKLEALYQEGYHTAEKEYEKLKEFLGKPEISGEGSCSPA